MNTHQTSTLPTLPPFSSLNLTRHLAPLRNPRIGETSPPLPPPSYTPHHHDYIFSAKEDTPHIDQNHSTTLQSHDHNKNRNDMLPSVSSPSDYYKSSTAPLNSTSTNTNVNSHSIDSIHKAYHPDHQLQEMERNIPNNNYRSPLYSHEHLSTFSKSSDHVAHSSHSEATYYKDDVHQHSTRKLISPTSPNTYYPPPPPPYLRANNSQQKKFYSTPPELEQQQLHQYREQHLPRIDTSTIYKQRPQHDHGAPSNYPLDPTMDLTPSSFRPQSSNTVSAYPYSQHSGLSQNYPYTECFSNSTICMNDKPIFGNQSRSHQFNEELNLTSEELKGEYHCSSSKLTPITGDVSSTSTDHVRDAEKTETRVIVQPPVYPEQPSSTLSQSYYHQTQSEYQYPTRYYSLEHLPKNKNQESLPIYGKIYSHGSENKPNNAYYSFYGMEREYFSEPSDRALIDYRIRSHPYPDLNILRPPNHVLEDAYNHNHAPVYACSNPESSYRALGSDVDNIRSEFHSRQERKLSNSVRRVSEPPEQFSDQVNLSTISRKLSPISIDIDSAATMVGGDSESFVKNERISLCTSAISDLSQQQQRNCSPPINTSLKVEQGHHHSSMIRKMISPQLVRSSSSLLDHQSKERSGSNSLKNQSISVRRRISSSIDYPKSKENKQQENTSFSPLLPTTTGKTTTDSKSSTTIKLHLPLSSQQLLRRSKVSSDFSSKSKQKQFKCDLCPLSFSRCHDLRRHEKIHSQVRPYDCKECGKSFIRKDTLYKHQRSRSHQIIAMNSGSNVSPIDSTSLSSSLINERIHQRLKNYNFKMPYGSSSSDTSSLD